MFALVCTLSLSALVMFGHALTHIVLSSIPVSCTTMLSRTLGNSNACCVIFPFGNSVTAGVFSLLIQGTGIYTGVSNAFCSTDIFSAVTISGSNKNFAHKADSFALIRFKLWNVCICFCLSRSRSKANDTPYGSQGSGLYRLTFTQKLILLGSFFSSCNTGFIHLQKTGVVLSFHNQISYLFHSNIVKCWYNPYTHSGIEVVSCNLLLLTRD